MRVSLLVVVMKQMVHDCVLDCFQRWCSTRC